MTLDLRPYQVDLLDRSRAEFASGAHRVLIQLPTGGGKTRVFAEILRLCVARGYRGLFLAHLDSLLTDTIDRLAAAGIHAGLVQADRPSDPTAPVQVASLQTLHVRSTRPPADLVICDEAHRVMGPTVRAIVESYPQAHILGGTATPQRSDEQPLGDVFERLICGPSVRELTRLGHLVPCDLIAPPTFEERGLAMDPVDAYLRWAPGSRAIIFAANLAHAEDLAQRFVAAGVACGTFVEDTPRAERMRLRAELARGDIRVLLSVNALVEGFDVPEVETVILARSFTATGSFLQAIGRGLRTSPATGKTRCLVADLRGAVNLHGLPDEDRRWSLDGKAVVRTESLPSLRRCLECLAIFRPSAVCPRCGSAATKAPKLPRNLNRAEKLEMLSRLPQDQRDTHYMWSFRRVAAMRIRLQGDAVEDWAVRMFRKRFGRDPLTRGAA